LKDKFVEVFSTVYSPN